MTDLSHTLSIKEIYRQSLKPADSWFNLYIARPLAAPIVAMLYRTPVTPNQVTFFATLIMLAAMITLMIIPGKWGLCLGVIGLEFSYILDCVDGQLARIKKQSSEVGGLLDFMMDEIKAYLMIAAVSIRLYCFEEPLVAEYSVSALMIGMATLLAFASAISLTRFRRSAEYANATGQARVHHGQSAGEGRGSGPLWPIKMLARLISQYPTSFPIFAYFHALDIFLYSYGILHILYAGQATLSIFLALALPSSQTSASSSLEEG
jgi:phosphatidylglycerophosphate synthase